MKKILITGATSGIGNVLMRKLIDKNYFLILVGKNEKRLKNIKKELKEKKNVLFLKVDLSNQKKLESFAKKYASDIDILINSAAEFGPTKKIQNLSYEEILLSYKVNVLSPAILTKYALPHMHKKGFGRIINLGSTSSLTPYPLRIPYGISKSALASLTSTINSEVFIENKNINIKSYILCIPPTKGNRIEKQIFERAKTTRKKINDVRKKFKSIKGKFFTPEEIVTKIINLIKENSEIDKNRKGIINFN